VQARSDLRKVGRYEILEIIGVGANSRVARAFDPLIARITTAVREDASPKHVPDEVIAVPGIPHTRTGKKLEVPIKRLLQGAQLEDVVDAQAVDDPLLLSWFTTFGRTAAEHRT